ncbi:PASTA domain-containing protein, partial [Staphylococcus aureus]|nr:PASTA domain-containing protein [Staphylococcus aureus]
SIKAGNKVLPHSKVLLLTDGDLTMPDMSGWTKEDVIAFENLTNIKVNLKGSGFVSHQSISKGQKLTEKDKIDVEFSSENVDSNSTNNSDSNSDDKKKSDSKTDKDKSD